MQAAGTVGTNGGKEVISVEPNKRILEFTTIACEKNCPASWPIADTHDVSFFE
jgi:hypothetical protein